MHSRNKLPASHAPFKISALRRFRILVTFRCWAGMLLSDRGFLRGVFCGLGRGAGNGRHFFNWSTMCLDRGCIIRILAACTLYAGMLRAEPFAPASQPAGIVAKFAEHNFQVGLPSTWIRT